MDMLHAQRRIGERLVQRMGQTGIRVMTCIMGLLLAALAVQFVIGGAQDALGLDALRRRP